MPINPMFRHRCALHQFFLLSNHHCPQEHEEAQHPISQSAKNQEQFMCDTTRSSDCALQIIDLFIFTDVDWVGPPWHLRSTKGRSVLLCASKEPCGYPALQSCRNRCCLSLLVVRICIDCFSEHVQLLCPICPFHSSRAPCQTYRTYDSRTLYSIVARGVHESS